MLPDQEAHQLSEQGRVCAYQGAVGQVQPCADLVVLGNECLSRNKNWCCRCTRSLSLVGYKKHQCGRVTSGFDTGMGLSLYNGQNIWSSFTVFFNCVLVLSEKELSLFVEACMVFSWMWGKELKTQGCFSYCWATLAQHQGLFCFAFCPNNEEAGRRHSWDHWPQLANGISQYHTAPCSTTRSCRKGRREGNHILSYDICFSE